MKASKQHIEKRTEQYANKANKGRRQVIFEPSDWVWVHMRKERFPARRRSKLHPRGDGPFQILEKINDNAYKVDLPGEDSWSNPFEERGNDGNQGGPSLKDPLQVLDGPITRSRAKKIKEAMQGLVQSTWDEASKSPNNQSGFERRRTNFDPLDTSCGRYDLGQFGPNIITFVAFLLSELIKDSPSIDLILAFLDEFSD
uniref:Tf2-1-like SH3-like domain-containing protein n=1 Tax=Fagus sylvatica TaxID=28930 RepID=A0A2N9GUE0_FAGSY